MNHLNADLDRRQNPRSASEKFIFLQMEHDDGGNVLDISEAGLRFATFAPVPENRPVHFWFSFNLRDRIEASGELVWTDAQRTRGGVRFLSVSEEGRALLSEWMTGPHAQHVSNGDLASRNSNGSAPGKLLTSGPDSVPGFVSKARSRQLTFLVRDEDSAKSSLIAPKFQETAEQTSGLVPIQKYLAAKRRHFYLGIALGACISAMIAFGAFQYLNLRRPIGDRAEPAGHSDTLTVAPAEQQAPLESPPASNHAPKDFFSADAQVKRASAVRSSQNRSASVVAPVNSRMPQGVSVPSAKLASQPWRSSESPSKKPRSRTPSQLWSAIRTGDSRAAVDLAELYIQGDGVPQNCMQARVLLLMASEKRNASAIKRLQLLDKTGCAGE